MSDSPQNQPSGEPSFGELLRSNLKIIAASLLLALLAYGIWRAAAWLFPDVGWLQPGSGGR